MQCLQPTSHALYRIGEPLELLPVTEPDDVAGLGGSHGANPEIGKTIALRHLELAASAPILDAFEPVWYLFVEKE